MEDCRRNGRSLGSGSTWVTCVSCFDDQRQDALSSVGLAVVSTYWSRRLKPGDAAAVGRSIGALDQTRSNPAHTFGALPFDPAAPGALVAADDDGNYAIGSPGIEPPMYDPGGPTCVVDQLCGPNPAKALDLAIAAAASRGDAQLVVVSESDSSLRRELTDRGFRAQIDLFART